jgi:hypothetical protein
VINRLLYRKSRLAVYRLGTFEILMDHRAGDQASARHVLSSYMYRRFLKNLE